MKNFLSHLIHLTIISEFEILFYIFYIVPFERNNIYKMFDVSYLSNIDNLFNNQSYINSNSNLFFILIIIICLLKFTLNIIN